MQETPAESFTTNREPCSVGNRVSNLQGCCEMDCDPRKTSDAGVDNSWKISEKIEGISLPTRNAVRGQMNNCIPRVPVEHLG